MPRTVSLGTMIRQLAGLMDTRDLSEWEQRFLSAVVAYSKNGAETRALTAKQIDKTEEIYRRHFA